MASQTRTPRQRQGDGLVPVMIRVTPKVRRDLMTTATLGGVSVAEVVRRVLEDWLRTLSAC